MKKAQIKQFFLKKVIIIVMAAVIVIAVGWFLKSKIFKPAPKQVYSAGIMVRSQHNPDPVEDARTSLKAGDVLVVQKEDHNWSNTEKFSYLILKMNLTAEQAAKLTRPKEKEIKFKDLSEEEQERIEDEKRRAKDEGRDYAPEPRRETIIAREYRINLEQFEGFTANDLLKGQPYLDQIFDWGIVEKKK